jgi:hypothetical protein
MIYFKITNFFIILKKIFLNNLMENDSIRQLNSFIKAQTKIKDSNSFERLKNLQLLIQIYSGLKEL